MLEMAKKKIVELQERFAAPPYIADITEKFPVPFRVRKYFVQDRNVEIGSCCYSLMEKYCLILIGLQEHLKQ